MCLYVKGTSLKSIRIKVVLPYLILTLLIAAMGVYILTNFVMTSLSERLTNQLLEAGRVVSDDMVRQEITHALGARRVAFVTGLPEALMDSSLEDLRALTMPIASGSEIESLFLYSIDGGTAASFR